MTRAPSQSRSRKLRLSLGTSQALPFTVELWNLTRTAPERVLGRAEKASIADQLFEAALAEYPARLIVLRNAESIIRRSA